MRILLVEDSPEVSLITVEYLTELGHQVEAVSDAEHALEQVDRLPFDAIITDVSLPGMSGIELVKALVKRHPALPVIVASGYGTLNLESAIGRQSEAVLVLTKPYDMAMLESTLARAAAKSSA